MDKSDDSSSDSDSNSSTSWVFVYDSSAVVEKSSNTFHLDCSREPIQELTEQDLFSAGSDIESDTDGISVISESEVPIDDPSPITQSSISGSGAEVVEDELAVLDDCSEPVVESTAALAVVNENLLLARFDLRKIFKPFNILGIGFVMTAIILASYNQIMTKFNVKDARDLQEDNGIISYDDADLMAVNEASKNFYSDKKELRRDLEEIVDLTITCTYGRKPRDEVKDKEIKRCVKKQYKMKGGACFKKNAKLGDEKPLKCNHEKPKINKFGEPLIEDNVAESSGQHNYREPKHKYKKKNKDRNDEFYSTNSDDADYSFKKAKIGKHKKSDSKENFGEDKLKYATYNLKEKYREGRKQGLHQSEKLKYKYQMPIKKPHKHEKDNKEYKNFDKKKHNYVDKKYEAKQRGYNKNVNKHPSNNKNFVNLNKDTKMYKDKENNSNKSGSLPEHKDKINPKLVVLQENNNTSGEWYTNLYKARTQIRKQEHVGDWVFDRAYLRNKKRNKAQWYFKWMNIREQLRYKHSYRPYSS